MASPIIGSLYTTQKYHPLAIPLIKFHGHIIKTFSPLTSKEGFFEVVKRILFAVISPIAYLVLAFVALMGAPIRIKKLIKKNSEELSSNIKEELTKQFLEKIKLVCRDHPDILKIKCVFVLNVPTSDKTNGLEINFTPEGSLLTSFKHCLSDAMLKVKQWFFEKLESQELEQFNFTIHAFCLKKSTVAVDVVFSFSKDSVGKISNYFLERSPPNKYFIDYVKDSEGMDPNWMIGIRSSDQFFDSHLLI